MMPFSEKPGDWSESADAPYPTISVVVVNYRSGPLLGRCLEALSNQTWGDFEVLLVDNGSDDGSIAALKELDPRVRLLKPDRNLGFAAANNLAANCAHGDWIATLNPDAFPDRRWLESLMDACRRQPGFFIIASAQLEHDRPNLLDGAGDPYCSLGFAWRGGKGRERRLLPPEGLTFGPCAAAAVYRRDAFLAVGGFDEAFFCYYEDVDLAFRMLLAGYGCLFVPTAEVSHLGSAVAGAQSSFTVYHIMRNRVWAFLKNMPAPLFVVLSIPVTLVLLQSVLKSHRITKIRALADALNAFRRVMSQRREVQGGRRLSWINVASSFTWSPSKILAKAPDVRPLPPAQPLGDERVCGVVVTYQPGQYITTNLRALLAQVSYVIVVDNGSEVVCLDFLAVLANQFSCRLEVVRNERNLGLARAQNQGIKRALELGYPWVLLMDDDSLPDAGMVQCLLDTYRDAPRRRPIGLLGPRIEREGMFRPQSYAIMRHRGHLARCGFGEKSVLHDLAFAIASGSLVSATVLKHVGVMREDFFIDYVDVEFCLRVRDAGYTIVAVNPAHLAHRLGYTEERKLAGRPVVVTHHPAWRRYHIFRNRAYLWRTYWFRWPGWVAFDTASAMLDLVRILHFEDDRRRKLSSALRGIWDGVRKHLPAAETGPR